MNKHLQILLQDSLSHYRARQLKKALNAAQIALEFGLSEGASSGDLVRAHLLLARIFNTNGAYQGEPSFFQKALHHAAEARRLNEGRNDPSQPGEEALLLEMKTCRVEGKIHLNLRSFAQAEVFFKKSLALARPLGDLDGEALALACLSRLHLEKNEVEEGMALAEEGLAFLKKNAPANHVHLWAEMHLQLSQACIKRQEFSRALEMSQELLRLSRLGGDVEKEATALRNIAVVCGVKSNYKIGMQYFLEALDKCQRIGHRELIAQTQVNIGTLYAHLCNYEEAVRRYESVLAEHGDLLDDKAKVAVCNNLGNIHLTTGQPQEALAFFEKACALALESGQQDMVAHSLAQSSRAKIALDRLEDAAADARRAHAIFEETGEAGGRQLNLLNLSQLAFFEKKHPEAVALAEQAIEIARRLKDDACEIRGYKHLAAVLKAAGDFEAALGWQERFAEIQEEFARTQRNRQFLDLEIRHAIREQQKEIEQLTKQNEMQALLLQQSDQIARQNQELLRANEDLRQFAYVASHDLREPLRMIGSYTQLIQRLTQASLDEKGREYFGFITDGVSRMSRLLEGLLRYATLGSKDWQEEQVNLNDVLHASLANLKLRIEETGASVYCHEMPVVRGSHSLLSQLFQNLVGNALKFVRPDAPPEVRIRWQELEAEHVVSVEDNGIGILPEHRERIFEIFQRLHARDKYEGTGIGLAICQKIAQRHGGRIWVESEEGEGAKFSVALPKS